MLCRELSSWDWNGFVVLRCLGSLRCHAYCQSWKHQSFGRFRTGQNLDLWDRVWAVFDVSCYEFCTVFIFLHDMSMGFMRKNHCDLFCSHVKSCACIDGWVWVSLACFHRSALSHCCLRHRSVNDHTLPVKMCGTHLGVIVSVIFIGSVNHLLRCEARTLGWMREREMDSCFSVIGWVVA